MCLLGANCFREMTCPPGVDCPVDSGSLEEIGGIVLTPLNQQQPQTSVVPNENRRDDSEIPRVAVTQRSWCGRREGQSVFPSPNPRPNMCRMIHFEGEIELRLADAELIQPFLSRLVV